MPPRERVAFWRWRVLGPGPPLTEAILVGEALRAAVTAANGGSLPSDLHDSGAEGGHRHAYWLSEDEDCDGRIDHVLVFAESGICAEFVPALAIACSLRVGDRQYALQTCQCGARPEGGLFGPATTWLPVTPFVTRLWRFTKTGKTRQDFTPAAQIGRELRDRNLPQPARPLTWLPNVRLGERKGAAADFVVQRGNELPNSDAVRCFPVLRFDGLIWGPIALGYGAHFGLGLMRPAGPLWSPVAQCREPAI